MKKRNWMACLTGAALVWSGSAFSEVRIGVTLPLTGPASGLGILMNNGLKLWPETVGGEKVTLIVLDDATDPGKGVQNTRRLLAEDKVDLVLGSGATPVAVAMAAVLAEASTVQIAMSPVPLPEGKDRWTFRIPHANGVMATGIVAHMKKAGVKSVGFIGYTDAYGESWLQEVKLRLDQAGITLVATERFARSDASVTAQALKLTSANPDAVLVVASGSGAAMPQLALVERGYKGRIYQTHAAATRDLMRLGGKAVEGTLVSSPAMVVADQLPAGHPLRSEGLRFLQLNDKAYGPRNRNALAAHGWDAYLLLDKVIPLALKKARPGTPEFRAALREALETVGPVTLTGGIINYTANDHWGYPADSAVILKVSNDDWKLEH